MAVKTTFTTSDGLVFTDQKKAEEHEATLIHPEDVGYIMTLKNEFFSHFMPMCIIQRFYVDVVASRYKEPFTDGTIGFMLNVYVKAHRGNPLNVITLSFQKKQGRELFIRLNTNGVTQFDSDDKHDMDMALMVGLIAQHLGSSKSEFNAFLHKLWDSINEHLNEKSKVHS